MPIWFIRLWRPSAKGRKPQRLPTDSLTALQLSHANHAQRDGPPAVARKQMMHRSRSLDTSRPSHFCGESSSRHDCHLTGTGVSPALPLQRAAQSPAWDVHGQFGDSLAQCRVSWAQFPFRHLLRHSRQRHVGRPPLARIACRLFPWGTVRWSRGCRDAGPGTRTASARELC